MVRGRLVLSSTVDFIERAVYSISGVQMCPTPKRRKRAGDRAIVSEGLLYKESL